MASVGMAQPSVLPAKSRRPVSALSAYLSNPGVSCVLAIMERIGNAGAGFRSIAENIDTTTPAGRMMMQMVGPSTPTVLNNSAGDPIHTRGSRRGRRDR